MNTVFRRRKTDGIVTRESVLEERCLRQDEEINRLRTEVGNLRRELSIAKTQAGWVSFEPTAPAGLAA